MHKFFKATIIVTIFAVATRALGFLLRIFLSRKMGAETLGSYQIAMSVFGVLMTIIASGIPLIVSRNVAYHEGKDSKLQSKNISAGLIIAASISIVICGLFFALGGILTSVLSKESINMIYILLPTLVVSSVYAILRGGMWGKKYFFTISFTEFFEQIVRIVLVVILFVIPLNLTSGQKSALSLTLSAIASCILVVILYFAFGGKLSAPRAELKSVLAASTPITLVRTVSSVIGSIIAIILPARLMMFGYTRAQALSIFGEYMGMTLPLIMVPSTLISSIAVALVPELSSYTNNIDRAQAQKREQLKLKINRAIKTTIAISFILVPAFLALGVPTCQVLFDNTEAGRYLVLSAALMVPMGLNQICSSILNAIGLEKKELLHYVVGAVALVFCVIFLPQHIGGYSMFAGLMCMNLISATLSIVTLCKRQLVDYGFLKVIVWCICICAPTAILAKFTYNLIIMFAGQFVATAFGGLLCVVFNILLMMVFNIADIKFMFIKFKKPKQKLAQQKTTA